MNFSQIPIRAEWFYYLEGEKTKLNWFLFETALEHYDMIRDSLELKPYLNKYSNQQIAQFCTYYARRMKEELLNCISNKRKRITCSQEYVDDFYPHHSNSLNRRLTDIANDAWVHMLSQCETCPQRCLYDYKSRTILFDEYID